MKKPRFAALLLFAGLLQSRCYYDRFNELHPLDGYVNACDTTLATTYTASINLIMKSNCTSCHSNSRGEGGVHLETYEQVKFEGANGRLVGTTAHSPGYQAMPPGTRIRDCELERIKKWVEAGMPE